LKSLRILASFGAKLTYGCFISFLQAKQQAGCIEGLNRNLSSAQRGGQEPVASVTNAAQVDFRFCDPARQFLAPPLKRFIFLASLCQSALTGCFLRNCNLAGSAPSNPSSTVRFAK
jgi:hypothetical protein